MGVDRTTMIRRKVLSTLGSIGVVGLIGCLGEDRTNGGSGAGNGGADGNGGGRGNEADGPTPSSGSSIRTAPTLAAPAFADGDPIPTRYTCDGENISPALSVAAVPGAAASLALIVDDPDAPSQTYTHWLLWGLPPSTETIPEGIQPGKTVGHLRGASQGTNDADLVGYSGPCPPRDHDAHTYRFRLLALSEEIDLDPGRDRGAFDGALQSVPHTESVLRGTYDR